MMRESFRHPQWLGNRAALVAAVSMLAVIGGLRGVLFGVAAVLAVLVGPPIFAFVIAQAGVAALATPPYSLAVVGAEVALWTVLLSDPGIPWTRQSRALAGGVVAVLAGGVWVVRSLPVWWPGVWVLVIVGLLIYGVHRYELLATRQLQA